MKRIILSVILISLFIFDKAVGQDKSFSLPGKQEYQELKNPALASAAEWARVNDEVNVSFASDNVRYPKEKVPVAGSMQWDVKAWKGEKVHTQVLVWSKHKVSGIGWKTGSLSDGKGHSIGTENIKPAFVRYVMTDEFGEGCGEREKTDYDSSLVEDPLDLVDKIDLEPESVRPVWITVTVPRNIPSGIYKGTFTIEAEGNHELAISLTVSEHVLPPPSEWSYDLDLWQSPDPIDKVHDVKLWSDEHYRMMKPYYQMLADAGQKSITAMLIDQPWGSGHVYYRDPTLIKWTKKKDGTWNWDYSVFDRYVSFVMSCGINKRINCYSMVTWNLSFIYYDESKGDTTSVHAVPGTKAYTDFWEPMLRDFTKHLKSKGWFDKTAIAMDERDMESMKAVFTLLKKVDPGWKTALAGSYHPEIAMDIYDYCIIIHHKFDQSVLEARKKAGKPSTYYTACGEIRPNGFSYSPPAENTWISWYAAANGFTGYLRWAYNNWTENTLQETRYRTWPAGDCYQIYPGPRSSIRFEKLIEGIQDFEKIRILKEQFIKEKDDRHLNELNKVLSVFTETNLDSVPAADMVDQGKHFIDEF
jgi:hypothetical protein